MHFLLFKDSPALVGGKYVYVRFEGKGEKTFSYPFVFKQGFLKIVK